MNPGPGGRDRSAESTGVFHNQRTWLAVSHLLPASSLRTVCLEGTEAPRSWV